MPSSSDLLFWSPSRAQVRTRNRPESNPAEPPAPPNRKSRARRALEHILVRRPLKPLDGPFVVLQNTIAVAVKRAEHKLSFGIPLFG